MTGSTATKREREKVAIVGTGIAGLAACWFLSWDDEYEVVLFEREKSVGMDTHSIDIPGEDGEEVRLNTPPRAFSYGYYPNLLELYRVSGVEKEEWSWAYSYAFWGSPRVFVRVGLSTLFGYRLPQYVGLWEWRNLFTPTFFYCARDLIRFNARILKDMEDQSIIGMTVREYCEKLKLSKTFIYKALLPQLSMICTCDYQACLDYPIEVIMHYYSTNNTHQYRTKYGTRDAVTRLTSRVERIVCQATVEKLWHGDPIKGTKPRIRFKLESEPASREEEFDYIICATQANHALEMMQTLTEEEKQLLQIFKHQTTKMAIHHDPVVMPPSRKDWSPMNMILNGDQAAMFTFWANDSFKALGGDLFQTWNPLAKIDPEKMIVEIPFERPVVTCESLKAVERIVELNGRDGVWFCGAWLAHRIPLQESGVISALYACSKLRGHDFRDGKKWCAGYWVDDFNHYDYIKTTLLRQQQQEHENEKKTNHSNHPYITNIDISKSLRKSLPWLAGAAFIFVATVKIVTAIK